MVGRGLVAIIAAVVIGVSGPGHAAAIEWGADGPFAAAARTPNPLSIVPIGCVPDLSAATLNTWMRGRLGPLIGFDNPKLVPLGGDRTLWLLSDPYVDLSRANNGPLEPEDYIHNTLMVQDGLCFSTVQPLDKGAQEFTPNRSAGDWFWPLGGAIGDGGLLYVFWSRMAEDGPQDLMDGITRHPTQTWIGVYDAESLAVVQFAPAPNSGVLPQYGSAVQTANDGYSYLFGNSNLLQLSREGGWTPTRTFSGTRMYLARVPAGRFLDAPQYFTGSGWSSSAAAARPISARWQVSNAMQPRLIEGRWYSAVKRDEFWGDRLVVEWADAPQGPWHTIVDEPVTAVVPADRRGVGMTTYQPVILPALAPDRTLTVVLSQNGANWLDSVDDPRLYRPQVIRVEP